MSCASLATRPTKASNTPCTAVLVRNTLLHFVDPTFLQNISCSSFVSLSRDGIGHGTRQRGLGLLQRILQPPKIEAYVSYAYACNSDRGARSIMDNLWLFDCAMWLPDLIYVTSRDIAAGARYPPQPGQQISIYFTLHTYLRAPQPPPRPCAKNNTGTGQPLLGMPRGTSTQQCRHRPALPGESMLN